MQQSGSIGSTVSTTGRPEAVELNKKDWRG